MFLGTELDTGRLEMNKFNAMNELSFEELAGVVGGGDGLIIVSSGNLNADGTPFIIPPTPQPSLLDIAISAVIAGASGPSLPTPIPAPTTTFGGLNIVPSPNILATGAPAPGNGGYIGDLVPPMLPFPTPRP